MSRTNPSKSRALLLAAALFAGACGQPDATERDESIEHDRLFGEKANGESPLEEIVANSFVLKNLEAMMVATRAKEVMQSPPYTLFAPWDHALNKLPYWQRITRDRGWHGHLRDLLLGHIHQGDLTSEQLTASAKVVMLNGDEAQVAVQSNRPRVDGATVIATAAAKDGHAHMLDGVREPRWARRTIADVIDGDERLTLLSQILSHPSLSAKRAELESADVGLTLFAPTDDALTGFDLERCQDAKCVAALEQLVDDHLVETVVSRKFSPTRAFETASGARLDWSSANERVVFTSAEGSAQEVSLDGFEEALAINGIVHPIAVVLGSGLPIDDGGSFACDITCEPGTVRSNACTASTKTRDESECDAQRAECCVGASEPCPTLCAPGQEFLPDGTLRGRTCQQMADALEASAPICTNPGIDVRYACCRNIVNPLPVASSPCYDFCGDTRQLVGSRLVPDGTATCWDYSRSISDSSTMCTSPDPKLQSACCGELRPPKADRFNACCLCEGCYAPARWDYKIGPEGRTCGAVDYATTSLPKNSDQCNATKEAFRSTCCDTSYEPPPPVLSEVMVPPPCVGPNPPGYCNQSHPACDLCKSGTYPKKPNTLTAVAYIQGNPTCADLYWMGREGALPPAFCYPIQNFMEEPCGCK
jgi:uncharacterized surface protein with fasciclin (FAS1) repeats